MKNDPNKIIILLVVLLCCNLTFAAPNPPAPIPPPPPGLSVDGNIIVLVFISILFGLYKIYTSKKASR